jgi:thiol-disulfide isomerase/thioredoxin
MRTTAGNRIMPRVLFTLLTCLCLSPAWALAEIPPEVAAGETLPNVLMRGLNGPSRYLADFRGKPLIINVWASWCAPCRAEMKSLERLAWRDDSHYLRVIGISTDDDPARAADALTAANATISHFIDRGLRLETLLGASRLPLTVLVDPDGRVVRKIYGARVWDDPSAVKMIGEAFGHSAP